MQHKIDSDDRPVWALVRPKVFALYFAFAVLGALLAGYSYELVLALI